MSVEESVKRVLDAGVKWIQYREKDLAGKDLFLQAERLRRLTADFGAALIINDHADIALAVDAEGVHLGQDDLPLEAARKIMGEKVVGISTHSLAEALEARDGGADYVGFGPVFRTSTKDAGAPRGLDALSDVVTALNIPVVAIGGIKEGNLGSVLARGVKAVALASAILDSPDPYRAARDLLGLF